MMGSIWKETISVTNCFNEVNYAKNNKYRTYFSEI